MIVIDPNMDHCRGLWFPEGTTVVYVSRPWSDEFFENVILPFARIGVTFKLLDEQTEDTADPSHSPELPTNMTADCAHKFYAWNVTTMDSLNAAKDATENMDDLPELLPTAIAVRMLAHCRE